MTAILYLIPVPFKKSQNLDSVLPANIKNILQSLDGIIVEERHYGFPMFAYMLIFYNIRAKDTLKFESLNEHSKFLDIKHLLSQIKDGESWGLMSDAGSPCIADPGSQFVYLAHKRGIKVIPLVGPCSIMLALMASGLDGQHFAFHGYLSRNQKERLSELKNLEKMKGTQIFMETPYRNSAVLEDALVILKSGTILSIACDLTLPSEEIHTKTIREWQKINLQNIHKRPAIFLLARQ